MSGIQPLDPPERTGSDAAQEVVNAIRDYLSVLHDGENWGRTIAGCENALAEALDVLIARGRVES